jgi:hypothetical protein
MKQHQNNHHRHRHRGRNNNNSGGMRRPGGVPNRNQTFDSNGPEVRIRGNAQQVYEKYTSLARDAAASGDRIKSESFLQHAEHYYRILATFNEHAQQNGQATQPIHPNGFGGDEFGEGDDAEAAATGGAQIITPDSEQPSIRVVVDNPNAQPAIAAAAEDEQPAVGDESGASRSPRRRPRS